MATASVCSDRSKPQFVRKEAFGVDGESFAGRRAALDGRRELSGTPGKAFAAPMATAIGAALVFCLFGVSTRTAHAQMQMEQRREVLTTEINPFSVSVTFSRFVSPQWELGGGFGFGFPQIDQTLFKGNHENFRDYAHLSAIARRHYGKHALLEMGARLGAADYQLCPTTSCTPTSYFGPSILFAIGSEHVKVGPRISWGETAARSGDLDVFASVSPINMMLSWRW